MHLAVQLTLSQHLEDVGAPLVRRSVKGVVLMSTSMPRRACVDSAELSVLSTLSRLRHDIECAYFTQIQGYTMRR